MIFLHFTQVLEAGFQLEDTLFYALVVSDKNASASREGLIPLGVLPGGSLQYTECAEFPYTRDS